MPFTIRNTPVTFNLTTFRNLVTQSGGKLFRWKTSSMGPLNTLVSSVAQTNGPQVALELAKLRGSDKLKKYADAVKYVCYNYPDIIDNSRIKPVNKPLNRAQSFERWFGDPRGKVYEDLIYGSTYGRGAGVYSPKLGTRRILDDFNNSVGLGMGQVFDRTWQGTGTNTATPLSVRNGIQTNLATPLVLAKNAPVHQNALNEYVRATTGGRYDPVNVFEMSGKQLRKDNIKTKEDLKSKYHSQTGNELKKKELEQHALMQARFVKSVRNACKGGIAMVSSSPFYKDSMVFFVLDVLGDLGALAFKLPLPGGNDGYVPITSSELCFCNRYWNHSVHPVKEHVRFFVSGYCVPPPWEADWTAQDHSGKDVYSNQEAWLRYELFRSIKSPGEKTFPTPSAVDTED